VCGAIFQIQDSKYIRDGADILIDSGMPTCLERLSRCSNLHDNRTINLLLLSVFHKNTAASEFLVCWALQTDLGPS